MNRILDISLRLLGAAAIAAPVASCSESTVDPDAGPQPQSSPVPIEYRTSLQTRAATLYQSASQIESFRVWAATEGGSPYILDDRIVKKDGKYKQEDRQDRYWPQPGTKLGFFAVSGLHKDEVIEWSADDKACVLLKDYKVVKDREEFKEETYEDKAMHKDSERDFDLLVAPTQYITAPSKENPDSSVTLTFRHALSCIEFRARNIDPALDVEITGIGLKHIQNVGDLHAHLAAAGGCELVWDLPDLSKGMAAETGETDDMPGDRRKPTFKIPFDKAIELHGKTEDKAEIYNLPDTETSSADPSRYVLMMIPQPLNAFHPSKDDKAPYRPHGSSLMLRANIWNVADDDGEHDDNDKKVWGINEKAKGEGEWMLLPCGDTWEPGKKYIYTVTFGGEGTYGGYEESEVKDDKDRVFDPIGFKVEIEPWIAGGDIVQNIY